MAKRGPKSGRNKTQHTAPPEVILGDFTPEQIAQLRQAVLDRATGRRVFVKLKRQGNNANGDQLWYVVDQSETAEWTGYIYKLDSDPQALKMCVEQFQGRPATKENAPIDPIVNVLLTVPGKRTVFTCPGCGLKTVGDPNDARPTDGVGEPDKSEADKPSVDAESGSLEPRATAPAYSFEPAKSIEDELFG